MKELSPLDRDWMYVRAASIMRKIYIRQVLDGAVGSHRGPFCSISAKKAMQTMLRERHSA